MIESGRPLRPFEIAELSEMNKTRIHNNLSDMLSKGSILMTKDINNKYYYPQLFFLDRSVLRILYEIMQPFIEVLDKNSDYSQLGNTNDRKAMIENIKMLLKLFSFDIKGYEE